MDDVENLSPKTNREWLQKITRDLQDLSDDRANDRAMLTDFMEEFRGWKKEHDAKEYEFQKSIAKYFEKVDSIEKRVNGWSAINSIGVIIASILAALGLKGS